MAKCKKCKATLETMPYIHYHYVIEFNIFKYNNIYKDFETSAANSRTEARAEIHQKYPGSKITNILWVRPKAKNRNPFWSKC